MIGHVLDWYFDLPHSISGGLMYLAIASVPFCAMMFALIYVIDVLF